MRNAIERIFGVVKRKFHLLISAPEFNLKTQARIPPAIAALFNFVRVHKHEDGSMSMSSRAHHQPAPQPSDLRSSLTDEESKRAEAMRDEIAKAMWCQYQQVLQERGELEGEGYLMNELVVHRA